MSVLGKNIRIKPIKENDTKNLAERLNVTPQTVSKWERNESNPDIQTLLKLSHYFAISVDELLGNKNMRSLIAFIQNGKDVGV